MEQEYRLQWTFNGEHIEDFDSASEAFSRAFTLAEETLRDVDISQKVRGDWSFLCGTWIAQLYPPPA